MVPIIVPTYAAILAFIYIFLAVRVIRMRQFTRIGIGAGSNATLERRIRVHANFAEYVPLALILLTFVEMQANSRWLVNILALALVAARVVHAIGVSQEKEDIRLRVAGMGTTFTVLIMSGLLLLGNGIRAAVG